METTNGAPFITSSSFYFFYRSYRLIGATSQREDHRKVLRRLDWDRRATFWKSGIYCCSAKRWRLHAAETRVVENAPTRTTVIDIPVTCYQLIGKSNKAEKDEIVKSVMNLKKAEVDEGYTMDIIVSRQDLLMDVRDKLLFEPEYAGCVKENIPPKASLRVPWSWLPAALCLLQEVGEEKLVLQIGKAAVQHQEAKAHMHDLLLSMALAECAIAKTGLEKNMVSQGFEALARAQCFLRSLKSLQKMVLLSEIEESLEELAPACTLELLGLPHSPENAERRQGAIAALYELLRQGLDVETPCRVQDWPCFLGRALRMLSASEIIDILPWDSLAEARKNKKSIESQNQRVVIDSNCFYVVLVAHIALGFTSRQMELIKKARILCECLVASETIDLKLEETFCLLLLGQVTEAEVVEQLKQLELKSNSGNRNSIIDRSKRDESSTSMSLEKWLKDGVLSRFPDTRDCSASLANFFNGERKATNYKTHKAAPRIMVNTNKRSKSVSLASELRDCGDSFQLMEASGHVGSAVKQLAPTDLQSPLAPNLNNYGETVTPSVGLKRELGVRHDRFWESSLTKINMTQRVIFVTILGVAVFLSMRMFKLSSFKRISLSTSGKQNLHVSSLSYKGDSSFRDYRLPAHTKESKNGSKVKKLLDLAKMQFGFQVKDGKSQGSCLSASQSESMTLVDKKLMAKDEAETLVKQWQEIKAEALGPSHQVDNLSEALDDSMLFQWQALADAAKARRCYWRFVLLQVTILRAEIVSDAISGDIAEIEALIEEAAELLDESLPKNPNYYSTYKVRYLLKRRDDGCWKFCEGDIQMPS